MRNLNFFILIFVISAGVISAQQNLTVKATVKQIFDLSSKSDYKNAATFFAFTGKGSDNLKRTVNPADSKEMNSVKRICKKIKGLLKISSSYEISEPENKKGKYISKAEFNSGKQRLHFEITFIKLENKFLLVSFK